MSTTTEDTVTTPPPAVREPTMLEQITGLTETVRRAVAERDEARTRVAQLAEDLNASRNRASRAEAYGVALDNAVRARDAEIRDLRTRLVAAQRALDAATRPAQPLTEPDPAPPPVRAFDAPRRPVRRKSWRRPPRRH